MTSNSEKTLTELSAQAAGAYGRSTEAWFQAAQIVHRAHGICQHGEFGRWLEQTGIPRTTGYRMLTIIESGFDLSHLGQMRPARLELVARYAADVKHPDITPPFVAESVIAVETGKGALPQPDMDGVDPAAVIDAIGPYMKQMGHGLGFLEFEDQSA